MLRFRFLRSCSMMLCHQPQNSSACMRGLRYSNWHLGAHVSRLLRLMLQFLSCMHHGIGTMVFELYHMIRPLLLELKGPGPMATSALASGTGMSHLQCHGEIVHGRRLQVASHQPLPLKHV